MAKQLFGKQEAKTHWMVFVGLEKDVIEINHVILIGRLTKDPDLRYTPLFSSHPVCNFT